MMNAEDLYREILLTKKKPRPGYGGNVLPAMEIYAGLSSFEERKAYQDALEKMLTSDDESTKSFAVNLCLGFFVFRDVLSGQKN